MNPGFEQGQYAVFLEELRERLGDDLALCAPASMTSLERMHALVQAIEYVCSNHIGGAFVECGVWQGGSTMLAARTFLRCGCLRPLHVFDTFAGMTHPESTDVDWRGRPAQQRLDEDPNRRGNVWAVASKTDFEANFDRTRYPREQLHIHAGDVRETLPKWTPAEIAVLRLDTDWEELTRLELDVLWPQVTPGGVVIVDDYGYWRGCRSATDEFVANLAAKPLALRVDFAGLLLIKGPAPSDH